MSQHNVVSASELVGLSEKTIYKHIKDGSLSATKDQDGKYSLETAELLRRYGAFKPTESPVDSAAYSPEIAASVDLRIEIASLRSENQGLKSLVQEKDKRLELLEYRKPGEIENASNLRSIIVGLVIGAAMMLLFLVFKFFFFFNA